MLYVILFYVQAAIYMLQGRDSENSKVVAKSMTQGERNKLLKTLRNRHTNWKNSRSEDSQVLYTILQEGKKKYCTSGISAGCVTTMSSLQADCWYWLLYF